MWPMINVDNSLPVTTKSILLTPNIKVRSSFGMTRQFNKVLPQPNSLHLHMANKYYDLFLSAIQTQE